MALENSKKILEKAQKGKYGIGSFNMNNMEFIQAAVNAASNQKSPLMLQTSEGAIKYAGINYIKGMIDVACLEKKEIPIVLHLDHGKDMEVIKSCIKNGYTSVMFDGSSLPYEENIKITKQVVQLAQKKDITVEAELGVLKGIEDNVSSDKDIFTDPLQAKEFVELTGCDSLAVAIGTSHGAYKFTTEAKLQIDRLKEIKKVVKIPLVLHGASGLSESLVMHAKLNGLNLKEAKGVPDEQIKAAIQNGICKINIDTDLRIGYNAKVREILNREKEEFDPRKYLGPARDYTQQIIESRIKLFGSQNKI